MKLIKQTTLSFKQGRSDKIYEVDLCEVGTDRFVVNFRYGRRGSALREGTRTPTAVSRSEADAVFKFLVESKTKKGYTEGLAPDPTPQSKPNSPADDANRDAAVLQRIREGFNSTNTWKLSRAIWRAGELKLQDAIPLLEDYVGKEEMTDYCIAWALGRIGQPGSARILERIASRPQVREHVKQIASQSLRLVVDQRQRDSLIRQAIDSLPEPLLAYMKDDAADNFCNAFVDGIGKQYSPDLLNALYYIDNEIARRTLLKAIETVPFAPPFFRPLRRVFKAAELRRDGQVFGLLAFRFEKQHGTFRRPSYYYRNYQLPTLGDNPSKAFSSHTRNYMRRRVWRILSRLGNGNDTDFVPMAVGVLLPFRDEDAAATFTSTQYDWRTNTIREFQMPPFSGYWAFSNILFGSSGRYGSDSKRLKVHALHGQQIDSPMHSGNEAAFVQLWKDQPRGLLHLLGDSRCRLVHEFAARVLGECKSFCQEMPLDAIMVLLSAKYEITNQLALDMAVDRYDPTKPDLELVQALAQCPLQTARQQARTWIESNRNLFFGDIDFAYQILTSHFADTRTVGMESLHSLPSDATPIQALAGRLIAFLQGAEENEHVQQAKIAGDVATALQRPQFNEPVYSLGQPVICDLLASLLPEVQSFAGNVVLGHKTFAKQPTEPILRAMLDATHPPVRSMGIKVISELPDEALLNNVSMLAGLTCHPLDDVRGEIRPVVKRLADRNSEFGRAISDALIQRLLAPGAPDGVPTHTSQVIRKDLAEHLQHVSPETVHQLLNSRSGPAQEVGGHLLPTHVDPATVSVNQIVKLSNNPVLTVRQAAWNMFHSQVDRIRAELATGVRILDSRWEDSRQFGFEFFEQKTQDQDLTPEVLISICDSVREDVQQFGRNMITKRFSKEHGPEYLVKLSEHPSTDLQLFASNFLAEYAADHPDRIKKLTPYFVSILSRVNKSRVAKDRVLEFLQNEAVKNREAAETISHVLDRISATCAIGDRARTIEAMLQLHETYPDIELPIRLKPLEVR